MEIKNRKTGEIIFSGEYSSMRECVEDAVIKKINLQWAELQEARLQGARLQGARLQGANLHWAKLQGARLQRANLQGAELQEADLQGARLQGANLQESNLRESNLRESNLRGIVGAIQWQSPVGVRRMCYSVAHEKKVMHKIDCFWGDTEEAAAKIIEKYGDNSLYEKIMRLNAEALQ